MVGSLGMTPGTPCQEGLRPQQLQKPPQTLDIQRTFTRNCLRKTMTLPHSRQTEASERLPLSPLPFPDLAESKSHLSCKGFYSFTTSPNKREKKQQARKQSCVPYSEASQHERLLAQGLMPCIPEKCGPAGMVRRKTKVWGRKLSRITPAWISEWSGEPWNTTVRLSSKFCIQETEWRQLLIYN